MVENDGKFVMNSHLQLFYQKIANLEQPLLYLQLPATSNSIAWIILVVQGVNYNYTVPIIITITLQYLNQDILIWFFGQVQITLLTAVQGLNIYLPFYLNKKSKNVSFTILIS